MPIAVITFSFDPLVTLPGDLVVRWQTIALAAIVLAVLVVSGILARAADLRADDLLSIAVGAVPGAVILGRVGYVIAHPEAFSAGLVSLVDPAVPGLDLGLGVVGGILTGAYVASLRKLLAREDERLWPTHGPPIDEPAPFIDALVDHRAQREAQILQCLRDGLHRIPDMVAVMYADVDKVLHFAAGRSVLAHLEHMVETGRVASEGPPTATARYRAV